MTRSDEIPRVTVRFWAGARAAAGADEVRVVAATVAEALTAVRVGRDEAFARVLGVCSLVVEEQPLGQRDPAAVVLADGDVIEVLPPFAGGSSHEGTAPAHTVSAAVPRFRPALLQLVLAGLLAVAAMVGPIPLWVVVAVAQLLLVVSWHQALGATDAPSGAVVGGLLIAATDVVVALTDDTVSYGPIAVVIGVGFLLAVVQQLARRDGRAALTVSLAATVSLAVVGGLGAGWVINLRLADGRDLTVLAAACVAAAAVGRLLPGTAAVVGSLLAGAAMGALGGGMTAAIGVGLGVAIGLLAATPAMVAALLQHRGDQRLAGWPAGAAWPVLLAPGLVYLAVRVAGS